MRNTSKDRPEKSSGKPQLHRKLSITPSITRAATKEDFAIASEENKALSPKSSRSTFDINASIKWQE